MICIRMAAFAILASFLLHPIGVASAATHVHSDATAHEHVQHLGAHGDDTRVLGHEDGLVNHGPADGACCSTSGMCVAILVVQSRVCEPMALDCKKRSLVRRPSAQIVATLLHPPIQNS